MHAEPSRDGLIANYRCTFFGLIACILLLGQESESSNITVRTLNIRYDNPGDRVELDWNSRKSYVASMISTGTHSSVRAMQFPELTADLIGLQEVEHNQLKDLERVLGNEYYFVGEGRDGKTRGEYNPILIKKDRFDIVYEETLWLAPGTPTTPKRAFGAKLNRIVTFAYIYDQENERKFWIFNTHLSHIGARIRLEQARVLANVITTFGRRYQAFEADYFQNDKFVTRKTLSVPVMEPIVVVGDFNARLDSDVADELLNQDFLQPIGLLVVDANSSQELNHPLWRSATLDPELGSPNGECTEAFRCQMALAIGRLINAYAKPDDTPTDDATVQQDQGQLSKSQLMANSIDWILHNPRFRVEALDATKFDINADLHLSDIHNMYAATLRWAVGDWKGSGKTHELGLENDECCNFFVDSVEFIAP